MRQRVFLVAGFLFFVALATAAGLLYANGVSHLNRNELRHFVHRQAEEPKSSEEAPIVERIPPEH